MRISTLAGLTIAAFAYPSSAQAGKAWLRVNASSCVRGVDGQNQGWDYSDGVSGWSSRDAICPYQDQNELQRDDLEKFNVYLHDDHSSGEAEVQLCRRSFNAGSGSCGAARGTGDSFVGYKSIGITSGLSDSAWQNTNGVAYVYLSHSGPGGFQYRGYYAENNISATPVDTFRGQPSLCSPLSFDDFHDSFSYINPSFSDGYFNGGETETGDGVDLICSYPERNGLQRDDLTDFRVYGSEVTFLGAFSVQLCRAAYGSGAGSCGAVYGPNGANIEADLDDLDTTAWNNTSGTAYMEVHLPARSSTGVQASLRGFYMESL